MEANVTDIVRNVHFDLRIGDVEISVIRLSRVHPDRTWNVGDHAHNTFEFHYIPEGRGKIDIAGHSFEVTADQFYITDPYVIHRQASDAADPMEEYCIECEINVVDDDGLRDRAFKEDMAWVRSSLSRFHCYGYNDTLGLRDRFEDIVREMQRKRAGFGPKVGCLMADLVIDMLRMSDTNAVYSSIDSSRGASTRDVQLGKLRFFLDANMANEISIRDACKVVFLGPRQVNRIMKEEFGCTFNQYLTRLRVKTAVRLLEVTQLSISQIARQTGFKSYHNMYKVLRREGFPAPSEIRDGDCSDAQS